jgi:uncharacterized protein (DUF433 family)
MSSIVRVQHPHVEVTDLGAVVQGTRVLVRTLWVWHRNGLTCDDLWRRYPKIPPGHILSALSFAYDNRELIETELANERVKLNESPAPAATEQLPLRKP